jgi:putative ABC transport system permease protein
MMLALLGGALGLALIFPAAAGLANGFPTFFPIVNVETLTIILAIAVALVAGIVSSIFPVSRALKQRIADGLRSIG